MTPSISHCPECGYSLQGLPARHRCPECGFAYDEHTQVWRPKNPRYVYHAVFASFGIWWLIGFRDATEFVRKRFSGWWEGTLFLFWILTTVFLVIAGWRAFHANKRGRFVAVGPGGLSIRTEINTVTVPWDRIREVKVVGEKRSSIEIEVDNDADKKVLQELLSDESNVSSVHLIIPEADRSAFAKSAEAAQQQYKSPGAE